MRRIIWLSFFSSSSGENASNIAATASLVDTIRSRSMNNNNNSVTFLAILVLSLPPLLLLLRQLLPKLLLVVVLLCLHYCID